MANKRKFYHLIISILVIAFVTAMPFILHNSLPIDKGSRSNIYYVVKVVSVISLIVVLLLTIFNKKNIESSMSIMIISATIIMQLLPLGIRILMHYEKSEVFAIILSFVLFIGYFIYIFSTDILNDKVNKQLPKLEGNKINVVDESEYYDQNGRFKGANK